MLSILRKARLKDKEMRILMLWVFCKLFAVDMADCMRGLDNAGKTTIVKKIMNEDVNSVSPTLGFIIKTIEFDGYEGCDVVCLNWMLTEEGTNWISVLHLLAHGCADTDSTGDVGGQKTLRTYWKNYFEKTDTLIWVVDATDRERVDDCRHELAGLLQEEVCQEPCA
jgi:ADP-ribosylation factor-like protein 2